MEAFFSQSGRRGAKSAGVALGSLFLVALTNLAADPAAAQTIPLMTMTFASPAFADGDAIPLQYTCDGQDISPPLTWGALPAGTRSLALIVEDPDAPDPAAPRMIWVHWVLYNIPPSANGLPEGMTSQNQPAGTRPGLNDWRRTRYGGPCPPVGRHRYIHRLYALDTVLVDLGTPTREALERAMQGHVLAEVQLVGTYAH